MVISEPLDKEEVREVPSCNFNTSVFVDQVDPVVFSGPLRSAFLSFNLLLCFLLLEGRLSTTTFRQTM